VDELEHYFAPRARRRNFEMTVRDAAEPDRWAILSFERSDGGRATLWVGGQSRADPFFLIPPDLTLSIRGSGLVDFEGKMARLGWTRIGSGTSDMDIQRINFRRDPPDDDTATTLAEMIRGAATALLRTESLDVTFAPLRGLGPLIVEAAAYRYLFWIGSFIVAAMAVVLVALATESSSAELAVLIGALAVVALSTFWSARIAGAVAGAAVTLEALVEESALVELPIVGPPMLAVTSLAMTFVGVWLPVALMVVIRWAI
jgi:hypothetical protein